MIETFKPKQGPIETLRDMRLDMLFLFFWGFPMVVAFDEGIPLIGLVVCTLFTCYLVMLQMWIPI